MSAAEVRAAVSDRFPAAVEEPRPESGNEFVLFSKPELGRLAEPGLSAVWDLFARQLVDYDVVVHRTKIVTGPELDETTWMQQHYGVINQISRLGRPTLTESAEDALGAMLADAPADALVLGGHQFLERYTDFSPFALAVLFSNAKVSRLGPGTYGAPVTIDGQPVIILNGFHPRQLAFFTASDAVCAFFQCNSRTDWEVLRSDMIGATDPSQAVPGSIRGRLYADPASFGLRTVSSNFNGVHMSAGPLEGLGELDRFFGEDRTLTDWAFARSLLAAGAQADELPDYLANPVLEADGLRGTAFDLTEGRNADDAAKLLVSATRLD